MKRSTVVAVIGLLLLLAPAGGGATVLSFDDLGAGGQQSIPNGYGGLSWSNFASEPQSAGPSAVFNVAGQTATITGSDFTFNGAYFTAVSANDLKMEVKGFHNGALLYDNVVPLNTNNTRFITFDYTGIDTLTFTPFTRRDSSDTRFVMDDFTYTGQTGISPSSDPAGILAIPEPATIVGFTIATIGVLLVRKLQGKS